MAGPSLLPQEEKPTPETVQQAPETPKPEAAPAVEAPETAVELPEKQKEVAETPAETQETKSGEPSAEKEALPPSAPAEPAQPVAPTKDRLHKEIEAALEEDLTDLFLKLPPEKKKAFQEQGEETASKIRQLVQKQRVNAKKIFHLIKKWLKIIPGVNKFFLEQEAKIKTDKILILTEEDRKRSRDQL